MPDALDVGLVDDAQRQQVNRELAGSASQGAGNLLRTGPAGQLVVPVTRASASWAS